MEWSGAATRSFDAVFLSQSERAIAFALSGFLSFFCRGVGGFFWKSGLGLSNVVVPIAAVSVLLLALSLPSSSAVVGELLGPKNERRVCSTRCWLRFSALRERSPWYIYGPSGCIALLRQLTHISYSSLLTVGNVNLSRCRQKCPTEARGLEARGVERLQVPPAHVPQPRWPRVQGEGRGEEAKLLALSVCCCCRAG